MPSPKLQNYLRANRKRLALSQCEVAFLLGVPTATKVSRHEQFIHTPTLEAALAYEVIFKRSVSELFSDLYGKIEKEVAERAAVLANRKDSRKPNRQLSQKHQILAALAALNQDES